MGAVLAFTAAVKGGLGVGLGAGVGTGLGIGHGIGAGMGMTNWERGMTVQASDRQCGVIMPRCRVRHCPGACGWRWPS